MFSACRSRAFSEISIVFPFVNLWVESRMPWVDWKWCCTAAYNICDKSLQLHKKVRVSFRILVNVFNFEYLYNYLQNIKIRDSFESCSSWGFWNCPCFMNLRKNWLRYSRLKTKPKIRNDTITFLCSCWACQVNLRESKKTTKLLFLCCQTKKTKLKEDQKFQWFHCCWNLDLD